MKIYKIKFSPEIIFYLFIRQKLCFLNEVMGGLFHDPHGGVLNKEKALSASCVGCLGVFLVDKRFEISNHDLIKDMQRLIKLNDILSQVNDELND